jgi:hypothetical protein
MLKKNDSLLFLMGSEICFITAVIQKCFDRNEFLFLTWKSVVIQGFRYRIS